MNKKCVDDKLNIPTIQIVPPKEIFKKYQYTTKYKHEGKHKQKTANVIVVSYYRDINSKYIDDNYDLISKKSSAYGSDNKIIRGFKSSSIRSFDGNGITHNGYYTGKFGFIYDTEKLNSKIYGKRDINIRQNCSLFDKDGNILNKDLLKKNKSKGKSFDQQETLKILRNVDTNSGIDKPIEHLIADTDNILCCIEQLVSYIQHDGIKHDIQQLGIVLLLTEKINLMIKNYSLAKNNTNDGLKEWLDSFLSNLQEWPFNVDRKNITNKLMDDIKEKISKKAFYKTEDIMKLLEVDQNITNRLQELQDTWRTICNENKKKYGKYQFRTIDIKYKNDDVVLYVNGRAMLDIWTFNLSKPLLYNECILFSDKEKTYNNELQYVFPVKSLVIMKEDNKVHSMSADLKSTYGKECIKIINIQMSKGLPFIYVQEPTDDGARYKMTGMLLSEFFAETAGKKDKNYKKNIDELKKYEKTQFVLMQKNHCLVDDFAVKDILTQHPELRSDVMRQEEKNITIIESNTASIKAFAETADKKDKNYKKNINKLQKYEETQLKNHRLADDCAVKNILEKHSKQQSNVEPQKENILYPEPQSDFEPQKEENERPRPQSDVIRQEEKNITIIESNTASIKATRQPFWLDKAPLKDKILWNIATLGLINLGRFGCCNNANNTATL